MNVYYETEKLNKCLNKEKFLIVKKAQNEAHAKFCVFRYANKKNLLLKGCMIETLVNKIQISVKVVLLFFFLVFWNSYINAETVHIYIKICLIIWNLFNV